MYVYIFQLHFKKRRQQQNEVADDFFRLFCKLKIKDILQFLNIISSKEYILFCCRCLPLPRRVPTCKTYYEA